MPGTREGGLKAAAITKQRFAAAYGKDAGAAYAAHLRRIGQIGGQHNHGHAFAHGKADPRIVGALGGRATKKRATRRLRHAYLQWCGREQLTDTPASFNRWLEELQP